MDQPKSIKCLSKNNKIYYTYSLEKKARQSREYYKQTEMYNARKRRHTFFKNVENMRKQATSKFVITLQADARRTKRRLWNQIWRNTPKMAHIF